MVLQSFSTYDDDGLTPVSAGSWHSLLMLGGLGSEVQDE